MKVAILLLLASLSLVGAKSLAQNLTPYEQLARKFSEASHPATVQDFDRSRWDHCLYVDIFDQYRTRETRVRTVRRYAPDRGPLFPGGTEGRVDLFNDPSVDGHLFAYFERSYIVPNPYYFLQVVDGPGWWRMNIYGKRDRSMLVFHLATSQFVGPNVPMMPQAYGYCWNEALQRPPPPNTPPPAEDEPDAPTEPIPGDDPDLPGFRLY